MAYWNLIRLKMPSMGFFTKRNAGRCQGRCMSGKSLSLSPELPLQIPLSLYISGHTPIELSHVAKKEIQLNLQV